MKKKSFLSVLGLCFILPCFFLLSACTKTPPTEPEEPAEPIKLNAPVVSLNDNIASWTSVDNATSYEVWIDSNTNTISITITQQTLTDGQSFKVRAVGDGTSYSTSDWSNTVTYTEPVTPPPAQPVELTIPVVSVNESGIASWNAVANASGYKYKINNGTEQSTTSTSIQLTDGDSIVVKAVGDGVEYADSNYSVSQTYTAPAEPTELSAPVVSINSTGLATWNAVANASGYKYKINNGTEQSTISTSVQLNDGDSIVVKAVGDGEEYLDSAYSSAVTYNANLTQLSAPTFTIDTSGQVVWQNVENATGYAYKINNGAEQIIGTTLIERCLQLSDGDSIMIKSLGDGVSYSDSNYSEIQTYTAPITPTVATYEYVCDLLAIKLQPIMQNSYRLGIVSDIEVERINAKNGMIYIHYHLGSPDRYALVQAEELATATSFQDIVDNLEDYTYTIVEKITSFQPTEDALALVEAGMYWGNIDALEGYTADDIVWATATTFNSSKETTITVVLEDETMVKYTLSCLGAISSVTAKDEYIYGCAHTIYNETTSEYQSLEDKLAVATYADVVSAIEANLNTYIQSSYKLGTVTNAKVVDITSNGTIIAFYNVGTGLFNASIQITGIAQATTLNEVYTLVSSTTNYGTVDNKTQMQSNEDAIALVQRGMVNGNISALDGYDMDDVSWVTATRFGSAKATDITVVFNDGKMVKYILTVSGAVSSTSAKNDYINGCAHNVSAGVVSKYQSLEDKLS